MAEDLIIASKDANKEEQYQVMLPQVEAIVKGETDFIANISNIMAILKSTFNHLWVGVYFVKAEELVLGPFQGPVACTRIFYGKGVCGKAWMEGRVIIVPDVEQFPGHIACSSLSKSEIVLPIIVDERVRMVLDIDSDTLNSFDETDAIYLSKVVSIIQELYKIAHS
ncbi:MAG: GAF domain-containing protein [Bacteroidota bacterium]